MGLRVLSENFFCSSAAPQGADERRSGTPPEETYLYKSYNTYFRQCPPPYLYNPLCGIFPFNYPPPKPPAHKMIQLQFERVTQIYGPEGANIYISHLPKFIDDDYLRSLFEPYGRILSTKVNINNKTGESKGIGFVSYNSREAAQRAIGAMNGYQIDNKRLRVQLKRPKGKLKPSGHIFLQ